MAEQQQPDEIRREYRSREGLYARLEQEASFILKDAIQKARINPHSSTSRVKTEDSVMKKAARKDFQEPLSAITDIVGLRVVCLFLTDLERVGAVIRESFSVQGVDNKIEGYDASTFGYMSVHYIVGIKPEFRGVRYDRIIGMPLEIQVRTVVMDAWATVSHRLSYKSDTDIPSDLRKDFYAISALFYVADKHFELFFNESEASRSGAIASFASKTPPLDRELNLDNLSAYLSQRFPDRRIDRDAVSELLGELVEYGYKTVGSVDDVVDRAVDAVYEYEGTHPPYGRARAKYHAVGLVRHAVAFTNPEYRVKKYGRDDFSEWIRLTKPPH